MTKRVTPSRLYALAGLLCLLTRFVPVGRVFEGVEVERAMPYVFMAVPLALASLALAFSHRERRTRGPLELAAASAWVVAAPWMGIPWGPLLYEVPAVPTTEVAVIALAGAGLLTSACVLVRRFGSRDDRGLPAVLQAAGGALLGLVLARAAVSSYVAVFAPSTESAGIAALARAFVTFGAAILFAAATVALGAAVSAWRRRSHGAAETMQPTVA